MIEIYTYEYIRAANEERRTRALARYEQQNRRTDDAGLKQSGDGADVFELVFATGCGTSDELSA